MKYTFFVLLFFTISFSVFASSSVKGKVLDSETEIPLDFVNVALYKVGANVPLVGVSSDKDGNFIIPSIEDGKYSLQLSFVGYNTLSKLVLVSNKTLNIGVVKLVEDKKQLKEVEVLGQGSQMRFEIDKKVFSVDQSIAAAGGSASDVLQNIPSVDVDGEGNVSLRNNSSVEVWINGKPSGLTADNRAQVLQQLPAESIDNIEVMTNPSAKFKPEGTSGIINIVLKKNRKAGYYGSVSAGAMYVDGSKITSTLGANINYSSSKLDAYLSLGYRSMDFKGGGYSNRYGLNGADTVSILKQTSTQTRGYSGLFGRVGVDYHFNSKNTISLSSFGMLGSGYSTSNALNNFEDKLNNLDRSYTRDNEGDGTRPSLSVSVDYKYDIDKLGSNLMTNFTYSPHGRTGNETIVQTENGIVNNNFTQTYGGNNEEFEFKVDYTKKFNEKSRLELGWNSTGETRESPASAIDHLNNNEIKSYYNKFDQFEYIHAAYATYGSSLGKLSFQGGLRAEYFIRDWDNEYYLNNLLTKIDGSPYDKLQLFPSAFISYSLPENNELQLNITRRISRPHGREINPFRFYSDSTNITYGNPDLLPELSSAFEFNYIKTWDNHTLSASTYYRFTDNVMQKVQFINNNTMENTTMNVAKSTNLGVEIVGKNRFLKVINLTTTLNLYYNKINSSSYTSIYNPSLVTFIPEKELFSWNLRSMANVILGPKTSFQLSGDYSAPRLIAQGKESASYALDFGLRQSFMNKNLSLSLMVRDILNTRKRTTFTSGNGFYQESQQYMMGRMIGITLTYNFGNMKPKQTEQKKKEGGSDMNMEGMD